MKLSSTDLYNLNLTASMQSGDVAEQAPTRLIQRQIDRGFASLRFMPALEREFHDYLRRSSRLSRAGLIFLAVTGVLSSALIDSSWLGLPTELVGSTRLIQFTVMMPMALICTLLCLRHPTSRSMEVGMLLLFVLMVAGLLGQRVVDSQKGFDLPLELVGVTAVAMFCLSRVRFWIQLPLLAAIVLTTVTVEIRLVHLGASGYYDMFSTGILLIVAVVAGYSSEYTIRWTWLNATLLRYLSRLDRLTGLLNRHALESALASAHAHAQREGKAYAIAMIDIDAFGAYNDHYGHQYGDAALQQVADVLADHARRPLDTCGRYGGEEFVLLWMDCGVEQTRALAESVREVVERERIAHAESPAAPWVTVSVGLCHVDAERAEAPIEAVLREADRALYDAKRSGRNRVVYTRYDVSTVHESDDAMPRAWPRQARGDRR